MVRRPLPVEPYTFASGVALAFFAAFAPTYLRAWQPYGPYMTIEWAQVFATLAAIVLVISYGAGIRASRDPGRNAHDA